MIDMTINGSGICDAARVYKSPLTFERDFLTQAASITVPFHLSITGIVDRLWTKITLNDDEEKL